MEDIDLAFSRLKELASDIGQYESSIITEQDTRLKVIDPMFVKVLGWQYVDIQTEERAGKGFIDYKLSIDDISKLIIEAKRDGRPFGLQNRDGGRSYKLSGPVFNSRDVKEGILQAIGYCGTKNTELAPK